MKWSNFHITVNFNVDSEDHLPAMREAIESMVELPFVWWWIKQFDGSERIDFVGDQKQLVDTVRIRAVFEHKGKQNHGLHVHMVVEIGHDTMVQVDKEGVSEVFRQFVNMQPNVHVRFVKGSGEDKDFILLYLSKEIPSYKPNNQWNSRLKSALQNGDDVVEVEASL